MWGIYRTTLLSPQLQTLLELREVVTCCPRYPSLRVLLFLHSGLWCGVSALSSSRQLPAAGHVSVTTTHKLPNNNILPPFLLSISTFTTFFSPSLFYFQIRCLYLWILITYLTSNWVSKYTTVWFRLFY